MGNVIKIKTINKSLNQKLVTLLPLMTLLTTAAFAADNLMAKYERENAALSGGCIINTTHPQGTLFYRALH